MVFVAWHGGAAMVELPVQVLKVAFLLHEAMAAKWQAGLGTTTSSRRIEAPLVRTWVQTRLGPK
jgi:hypothetical protein